MKRKNKSVRNSARSQPLPTTANAGEVAFARGISRRVVVVDAAESPLFEQIIYIVRDDAAGGGVTAADLVQQAREAIGSVPAVRALRPKQRSYTGLLIGLCSVAAALAAAIGYCLYCGWGAAGFLDAPEGCCPSGAFSAQIAVVNACRKC